MMEAGGGPPVDEEGTAAGTAAPVARISPERQCLTWSRVHLSNSTFIPPPRSGAASVVVGKKLYVAFGYGGGTGRLDDMYSYDFERNVWEEVQVIGTERPGCRENNGLVSLDNYIILWGGYSGEIWLNDLWRFDIQSHRWECIQESSDTGPAQEASFLMEDAATQPMALGPAWQVRGKAPSRRFGCVSVVHEGKLIVWAGFDGSRWLNCMFEFNFATKTWSEIKARGHLPSARSCPAWSKSKNLLYVHAGYDGVERKADFFCCDLTTYTWTQMPCFGTPPSPRYFHSCCIYGEKLWLYGGYSGNERLADMYAYDFETNHWSEVDCTGGDAPSGRSSFVAQVYSNFLYVFGGYNGMTVLNDFHKFRLKPIGMPPPTLVSDFGRLINNPELADVRFVVEGKDVFAHRAVLACRSEYFRVLLTGGMRESLTQSEANVAAGMLNLGGGQDAPIHIQDVSHTVFLQVLEFLYTDSVSNMTLDTGIHLMIASEQFMLDRLKSLCEDVIRRDIDLDNCIGILVASHRHHASNLKEIALEFIMRNLSHGTIRNALTELKPEPDLLVEILQRTTAADSLAAQVVGERNLDTRPGHFGAGAGWSNNARR